MQFSHEGPTSRAHGGTQDTQQETKGRCYECDKPAVLFDGGRQLCTAHYLVKHPVGQERQKPPFPAKKPT